MPTCAQCAAFACRKGDENAMPANCPGRDSALMENILDEYMSEENNRFFRIAAEVEKIGYCRWPRVKETLEFCRRMGYKKVGMAFCMGLRQEAKAILPLFADYGIELVSVVCKTGGIPKQKAGIPEECVIRPGTHESICNPIAQARILNAEKTEFNIALGLCIGHDSLFYKHSDALATTLVVKDRALANNPAGAIYCANGYFKARLSPDAE